MSNTAVDHAHDHSHGHDDHSHDEPHGWRRYLLATNHKVIGNLYLIFAFTMLMAGGVMALLIRSELFQPGLQYMQPEFF
ncbi:MAG: cytochrome c oxidase subunit I, partial [Burkholderiales bacterium]|nr:cytochrome c oxidase subunit I [Burkholderiales bacterium]